MLHPEVLDKGQITLLPHLGPFRRTFYLAGDTAIALHIGHRRSIDFDLFSNTSLVKSRLRKKLAGIPFRQLPLHEDADQLHVLINNVKTTFLYYPYPVSRFGSSEFLFSLPGLVTLAAMKTFALGRRAKWKDYVDIYFLLRDYYTITDICEEATTLYGDQFSEKIFREQLAFHKDIDYSEQVEYMNPAPEDDEIKKFLIDRATQD